MKKTKSKQKFKIKKKIIIFLVLFIILLALSFLCFRFILPNEKNSVNIKDNIDNYSYTLDDRDNKLFEKEYQKLKTVLSKNKLDYEEYAKGISKLFILDFYTLNNKISKYDVGGLEFVNSDIRDNFKLKSEDTIYNYIGQIENKELPEIENITVESITEEDILFNSKNYTGYKINLTWNYTKKLGYDTKGTIKVINNDNILEIVEFIGE